MPYCSCWLRVSYSHLAGNRANFNTINAWDYNYGITARIPILGGIGLSTDFTIFSCRGYDDSSLNSDDAVWNMRLERSVLNGNLTFAVDGFDILHNLSRVTRTVKCPRPHRKLLKRADVVLHGARDIQAQYSAQEKVMGSGIDVSNK